MNSKLPLPSEVSDFRFLRGANLRATWCLSLIRLPIQFAYSCRAMSLSYSSTRQAQLLPRSRVMSVSVVGADGTPRCGLGFYKLPPMGSVGRHWYAVGCFCVAPRPFS